VYFVGAYVCRRRDVVAASSQDGEDCGEQIDERRVQRESLREMLGITVREARYGT
jgi:hypothetical protein